MVEARCRGMMLLIVRAAPTCTLSLPRIRCTLVVNLEHLGRLVVNHFSLDQYLLINHIFIRERIDIEVSGRTTIPCGATRLSPRLGVCRVTEGRPTQVSGRYLS
ncbi:hypothetical protein F4824DRAFT_64723 [Ustulina deusta]|nr:hypothetical protein F4824DRAFT_64723 [Ustulina deusta]